MTRRLFAILLGAGAFVLGLRLFAQSYSATRWPIAPGRIITSRIAPADDGRFVVQLEYEYLLAGRVYRGAGIRQSSKSDGESPHEIWPRASAESLIARFPAGREIMVGYDPGDPHRSALDPVVAWWSLWLVAGGAGLAVGAYRFRS